MLYHLFFKCYSMRAKRVGVQTTRRYSMDIGDARLAVRGNMVERIRFICQGGEGMKFRPCDEPCPKCCSSDIHRHLTPPGVRTVQALIGIPADNDGMSENEFAEKAGAASVTVKMECITHVCRTCGHWWFSATADSIRKVFEAMGGDYDKAVRDQQMADGKRP